MLGATMTIFVSLFLLFHVFIPFFWFEAKQYDIADWIKSSATILSHGIEFHVNDSTDAP